MICGRPCPRRTISGAASLIGRPWHNSVQHIHRSAYFGVDPTFPHRSTPPVPPAFDCSVPIRLARRVGGRWARGERTRPHSDARGMQCWEIARSTSRSRRDARRSTNVAELAAVLRPQWILTNAARRSIAKLCRDICNGVRCARDGGRASAIRIPAVHAGQIHCHGEGSGRSRRHRGADPVRYLASLPRA